MLEIFLFKECLGAWVKSCEKFGKMNDDYIDQQAFFSLNLIFLSMLLHGRAANFLNTPRSAPPIKWPVARYPSKCRDNYGRWSLTPHDLRS